MLTRLSKYLFTITVFGLAPLTVMAAEPPQAILSDLVRSRPSVTNSNDRTPSLLKELAGPSLSITAATELYDGSRREETEELFALDELGIRQDDAELAIPEDLPVSDIPLTMNSKVEYFVNYFQTRGKASFSKWLSRSSRYIPMMKALLKREGMPEDLVYLAMIESGFQLNARSWASAVGPWQFMSGTGKRYALRIDLWVDERKDPVKATTAAALYLKELHGMFNGDWYLAAAGYNAGENKIMRAMNMYKSSDFWEISQGSYLKRETKEYVPKLLAAAIIAKDPAKYGFSDIAYLPPVEFDTTKIPARTDLELVAKLAGTTYEAIRDLNPALRHWCTPPNYPDYELHLPKGTKQQFEAAYNKWPAEQRYTEKVLYTRYQAKRRDTLKTVARRFGTRPEVLADINGLSKKARIGGKTLIVPAKNTVNFKVEGRAAAADVKKTATKEKYYTVKKGDTLDALARRFKVSSRLLAAWNNLKGKIALKPGRRLIVARQSVLETPSS